MFGFEYMNDCHAIPKRALLFSVRHLENAVSSRGRRR